MINNYELIVPMLQFPTPGDSFYFVQLIQRRKDNPEIDSNSKTIHTWYVESIEYFERKFPEMMGMADVFNARVSICLNPLSYEKTAFKLLEKIANQMQNKDFRSAKDAYNSVCGNYQGLMQKRWLVDIDSKDKSDVTEISGFIKFLQIGTENHILASLPTKNGWHLITHPFDTNKFLAVFPEVEIHKNNPTLLYIP